MTEKTNLNLLEKEIREIIETDPLDTVELSDLSEGAYNQLKYAFERDYEVRGIINILRMREGEGVGKREYILHISKKV